MIDSDDPTALNLDGWVIPGAPYVRRKIADWEEKIQTLPKIFSEIATDVRVDPSRPSVEFYRSSKELVLYMPVF
jgi:hypothetical protein